MNAYSAAPREEDFRRTARVRTRIVLAVMILWAAAIVVRLFHLQIFTFQEARGRIEFQNQAEVVISPDRGVIRDRRGTVLAQMIASQSVQYFYGEDTRPDERLALVRKLAPILGLEENRIASFRENLNRKRGSIWLKRKIDAETAARVEALELPGVKLYEEPLRFYPQGSLAAHVLGFVNIDNIGLGGVEFRYNETLQGKPGKQILFQDVAGRPYRTEQTEVPERGRDIDLTLDARIQYLAQREIEKAVVSNNADWGAVIVSDPATGEILAMASSPAFDPNAYAKSDPSAQFERSFRTLIDPGSTFKIVTAAAALEHRKVATYETFDCSAKAVDVAGGPIRDHKPFGVLTFSGIIAQSSNIGTIQIGRRIGPDLLYKTIKDFGFGEKTGIDLSAEASGLVHPPETWSRRSIDSVSVGYEVSATLLQLLQAVNIVANRGIRVPPRIIRRVDGGPWPPPADFPSTIRVISTQTAEKLIDILERVVLEGTGTAAALNGYTVAGKTGTSQIFDPVEKKYSISRHTASFIGFVPTEKPVLSIGVVLYEPRNDAYYGGQVAAPVFRAVALPALRLLGVYPSPGHSIMARAQAEGGSR